MSSVDIRKILKKLRREDETGAGPLYKKLQNKNDNDDAPDESTGGNNSETSCRRA